MPSAGQKPAKKATNVSIDPDLITQARELNINLSATLEQALVSAIRQRRREEWLETNEEAITSYNEHVEQHGVFSRGLRSF
jgi:antitoxin CcdA